MPTYIYTCEASGHQYQESRSMDEEQRQTVCPNSDCNSPLRRVWNAAPIMFKGTGFYSSRG